MGADGKFGRDLFVGQLRRCRQNDTRAHRQQSLCVSAVSAVSSAALSTIACVTPVSRFTKRIMLPQPVEALAV
jgi:hypothetical protein